MQTVWPPSHDSIFGDTYQGVPNPNVPHRHPYPTRYHGPVLTVPGTAQNIYAERPYTRPPFMGFGAAPLADLTGSSVFDAAIGATLGFVGSPKKEDKVMWAIIGGVASYAAGMIGVLGTGGLLLYARSKSQYKANSVSLRDGGRVHVLRGEGDPWETIVVVEPKKKRRTKKEKMRVLREGLKRRRARK